MSKYEEIPVEVLREISFMLGSIEACNSNYLQPILAEHGYEVNGGCLCIEPEDDTDLTVDIYDTLFK